MPEGRAEGAGFALVDAEDADALESEELEDPQAARARAARMVRVRVRFMLVSGVNLRVFYACFCGFFVEFSGFPQTFTFSV